MVADEVVSHFQLVEGVLSEVKPDQEFFYTPHVPSWLFRFFVVFRCACHNFDDYAKRPQKSEHSGVQSYISGNHCSYHSFSCSFARNNVANQIFLSLVAAVQLFVAVMFFVVVGVKVFQHVPRSFGQGCVDVVEVENVFSVSQPLVLDKKLETLRAPKIKHQTKP